MNDYNVNHDAEWLADVCKRLFVGSDNDFDKGWNMALRSVINIIEECMIPKEGEEE